MGGRVAGVGAELTRTGSPEVLLPETEASPVLGDFPKPDADWLPTVVAVDRLLSVVLRLDWVIVMVELRVPAGPIAPVLRVAESLPS